LRQFIEANWLSILSIVIGVVVAYVFYRLQKRDSASASAERVKHAIGELLDVVESCVINKQRLSEGAIENLILASERVHSVSLRPVCTPVSLLQDVALRLQRSRHLDIPQKSEYSETIELLIAQFQRRTESVDPDAPNAGVEKLLGQLVSDLPIDRKQLGEELRAAIAQMTEERTDFFFRVQKAKEAFRALTALLSGTAAAFATALIGSKALEDLGGPALPPSLYEALLPTLGVGLATIVLIQVLSTGLRIKRRERNVASPNKSADS
jgi:hypothetical protein